MQKPKIAIQWLYVEKEANEPYIDYNGKPLFKYFVSIPYWLIRAYRPVYVKVEIHCNLPSYKERLDEQKNPYLMEYFKKNWSQKMRKMRKLNHNYLLVTTQGVGKGFFKSIKEYEEYHEELRRLNKKYGV